MPRDIILHLLNWPTKTQCHQFWQKTSKPIISCHIIIFKLLSI